MINIKGVTQRGENTYRFTVSTGFDGNGKHIRKTMTFKVPAGTARTKAEKLILNLKRNARVIKILMIICGLKNW